MYMYVVLLKYLHRWIENIYYYFMGAGLSLFFGGFFYKFILFLAALGLHCCARAFSSCGERVLLFAVCVGFSLRWLLLLQSTGSSLMGFSSCCTRAQ